MRRWEEGTRNRYTPALQCETRHHAHRLLVAVTLLAAAAASSCSSLRPTTAAGPGGDAMAAVLPSVALWLDAGWGVDATADGLVTHWRDRSPAGHHAVSRGKPPWLVPKALPGSAAISFGLVDGEVSAFTLAAAPSLAWGTQDFWVLMVVRSRQTQTPVPNTPNALGAVFAKTQPRLDFRGPSFTVNSPLDLGVGLFAGLGTGARIFLPTVRYSDGAVRVFAFLRSRARQVFAIRVDGEEVASMHLPPFDISIPGTPLSIGADPWGPCNQFEGDLFELIAVVGQTLDESQLRAVEGSLIGKYAGRY